MSHARWWLAARGVAPASPWYRCGQAQPQRKRHLHRIARSRVRFSKSLSRSRRPRPTTRRRAGARRPARRGGLSERRCNRHRPQPAVGKSRGAIPRTHAGVQGLAADGPPRCGACPPRSRWAQSIYIRGAGGLVLRPRRQRQQGRRSHSRGQLHRSEARWLASGARRDRRSERGTRTSQDGVKWLLSQRRGLVDAELAFNTDGGASA